MDIQNRLLQIGLTKREAEIYIALLQKKEFSAPELTKITTITRTKIYEILQNLVHKGICVENIKNGNKIYRAIAPKIALQNIITNYEQTIEQKKINFEQKQKVAIELKKKAAEAVEKELIILHNYNLNNIAPLDYIEVLTDLSHIRNRWEELQGAAKFEMLVFNKTPYSVSPEENIKDETSIIKKGITYKGIYEYCDIKGDIDWGQFIRMLSAYKAAGEKFKLIEKLPMKLAIIDEKITMLALNDPISMRPSITTMIINHPGFSLAQKKVFEAYWNDGVQMEDLKRSGKILNTS